METTELQQRLQGALCDFLWDQWVALGLAGHASGKPVPFVIDPEALLLATLRLAMDEARFRDEVLDWLKKNGALLSVQRMKNLNRPMPWEYPESLRALGEFMENAGYRNWKTLEARFSPVAKWKSAESNLRGMSQLPNPARPEVFLLRMRMLFGVNARAEVITWLLTHTNGHAARIARETCWFSKSVQSILNDLEQAGILITRTDGKRKEVVLNPRGGIWHSDLATPLRWFSQAPFYRGIECLLGTLKLLNQPGLSARALAIVIRQDILSIEAFFRAAGLGELYTGLNKERAEVLVGRFIEATSSLVGMVEDRAGLRGT